MNNESKKQVSRKRRKGAKLKKTFVFIMDKKFPCQKRYQFNRYINPNNFTTKIVLIFHYSEYVISQQRTKKQTNMQNKFFAKNLWQNRWDKKALIWKH